MKILTVATLWIRLRGTGFTMDVSPWLSIPYTDLATVSVRCLLRITGCEASKSGVFGRTLSCGCFGDCQPGGHGADLLGTPGDTLLRGIGLGTIMYIHVSRYHRSCDPLTI